LEKKNVIVVTFDEMRPDHLSCFGYTKLKTLHIDRVAEEGVRFETCISSADFTPIAMGTVTTGKYPFKHGMRDPYCHLSGPTIGGIFHSHGYKSAGFVGNGLLAEQHGFGEGYDFWNQSSQETSWLELRYEGSNEVHYEGNWWPDLFFEWLKDNYKEPFFMWGHLYETHEGSEASLLERGLIKEGEYPEFAYYDAKMKMADELIVARLMSTLEELNVLDNTIVVVMSDHGTNLGERPAKQIPWRAEGKVYPQHTTMYDHDLRATMILRGPGLPKGKLIKGMTGSVDLLPTLLDLVGIAKEDYDFDGVSWVPVIERGESKGRAIYSEDTFEPRGDGAFQSIRGDEFKFIRNLTLWTEQYYDLSKDPAEKNNIIDQLDKERKIQFRKKLNAYLKTMVPTGKELSKEEKEKIDKRLRALGYIK